jgi:hypothetical protein
MNDSYDIDDLRKNLLTEKHVRLIAAEVASSLLKDQKLHIMSNIDKQRAVTEEKFSERYAILNERLKKTETLCEGLLQSMHKVDSKIDMWVNRGIGVWGLAVALFALLQYGTKLIGN